MVIMINYVSRAFFEAPMQRYVCVELPTEATSPEDIDDDMMGLLVMSLYGTSDAAALGQSQKVHGRYRVPEGTIQRVHISS